MSYVYAFLAFALLIVLHEAGHFVAAKAVGMRVERFSLFFGPMWLKHTIGETEYGVAVIPLGGYVKITGMTADEEYESPEIEARAYYNQPVWKRIVVIGAGPAVNLVLAFVLAWFYFLPQQHVVVRHNQPVETKVVAEILEKTPAAKALKGRDVLVSVNGVMSTPEAMHHEIQQDACPGGKKVNGCIAAKPLTVVVKRHGVLRTFHLRPQYSHADREMMLGFGFLTKTAKNGVIYSMHASVTGLWRVTRETISDIAQLFKSKDRKRLNGVVGGYKVTQEAFNTSASETLEVLALISLSLGVINLFPFLPLDGGHIFWGIVEKIRGQRVSLEVMQRAGLVGVGLILILFVIGLSNSITEIANHTLGTG